MKNKICYLKNNFYLLQKKKKIFWLIKKINKNIFFNNFYFDAFKYIYF